MKVLLAAVTLAAIIATACSSNEPKTSQTPGPATAIASADRPDRDAALANVRQRFPALLPAIESIESEDEDEILDSLRWERFECTPEDHRGGIAPRCTELEELPGTLVPMFHYELLKTSYFTEDQMLERLENYLLGRSPELALIAAHPDGRWRISFMVADTAGEGLRAVDFAADAEGGAPLTSHKERFEASTPLDALREDGRVSGAAWEVIYASDALRAWDAGAQAN